MISETEKLAIEVEDMPFKGWSTDIGTRVAAELRRLAAVEQQLEALKRAIGDAEPVAWMYDWVPAGSPTSYDWISSSKEEVFAPENGYFNIRPLYTLKGIK